MVMNKRALDGLCVDVEMMEAGILATNVYFVGDGAGGVIVADPADDAPGLIEALDGRPVSAIFVTHGHYDHVTALDELHTATGAPVYAMAQEVDRIMNPRTGYAGRMAPPAQVDIALHDGDVIEVGDTRWRVLHTPGHTEGCACYLIEPSDGTREGAPVMVAGDTLFYGSIGRTDLDGGDMQAMRHSLAKLAQLSDDVVVLPGHNAITSIGLERERTINPLKA